MSTLYININGDDIKSTESITVVGKPGDAIINKFYFELVKGIVKGVTVPGIGDVKNRRLVTDFEAYNEKAFAKIMEQWDIVKQLLLGVNPVGIYTVTLPQEYVEWLYNHGDDVYNKIAPNLAGRGNVVEISIDKIYKNAIGLLVNNIDSSIKYDSFTVNDKVVNDDSAVSVDIRKKIGDCVFFVSLKDFESKNYQISQNNHCCDNLSINDSIYAKIIYDGNHFFKRNERYRFYDYSGKLLSDDEYRLVAHGSSKTHELCSLLVVKTDGDSSLYYLKPDGSFYIIGDYSLQDGYITGKTFSDKAWWKYTAEIVQDRYVVYRNNRHYKIFEICDNGYSLNMITEFSSSEVLWYNISIIGHYIVGDYCTIDLKTGEQVLIEGYKSPQIIGMANSDPIFLASYEEDWEYYGSHAVNLQGEHLWTFNYDDLTEICNNLIIVKKSGKYGIVNLLGEIVVDCQYDDISEINNDVFQLDGISYENDKYYIVSKQLLVDDYTEKYYIKYENGFVRVYSIETDGILFEEKESVNEYNHFRMDGDFVITKDDHLFSLKAGKVVYKYFMDNPSGISSNQFAIFYDNYFEIYDFNGKLIDTISHEGLLYCDPVMLNNGYILFSDHRTHKCGYYDNSLKKHIIENSNIQPDREGHISIEYASENCFIITGERQYIINNKGDVVFKGWCLEKIDEKHYYGSQVTGSENDWCIIDTEKRLVPICGQCGDVYLIK